ncbi:MAG: glycosyltransferase family 2 protein [Clostridia bacterium]|nr:glycosyltransferase family 2 protein [Clostridia bacterium]
MKKVSIIVPIYNMESFIESGVECLCAQTYNNIEVLLVDDGSSDESYKKCVEAQKRDSRIRAFTKENEGAGPTRNFGIEAAQGDYAYFFDIDDYLYPNAIERLVAAIEEKDTDLVVCSFELFNGKNITKQIIKCNGLYREGEELRRDYYDHCFMYEEKGIQGAAWYKLYKMSIIRENEVLFPYLRRSQDEVFVARYVSHIKSVYFISDILCRYFVNDNERTWSKFPLSYFSVAKESTAYLMEIVYAWNTENIKVRNKILCDYYHKTFLSIWITFCPRHRLGHIERYRMICDISKGFVENLPCRHFGIETAVLYYMIKQRHLRLYLRMALYSLKHRND